ncbi:MAG TPA: NADH-quinone oxidoreductase subunit L [Mucilaginibacter sp.]|nr:NADH-quinone oxidoreductase subunit L [Mucilaginibacter sp.]
MEEFLRSIDTLTLHFTLAAVLLPLLAFIINFSLPGRLQKMAGWISTISILISCIISASVFSKVWNGHVVHQQMLWFTIGSTKVYAGILLNNLSVLMLLLVNLIALPVHIYSTAYMKDDDGYSRYFAYLSFFCFSMLALVVADNLVLFYIFWELVGFSSYLLIGFWFTRDSAVQANKKAFIMNRIGDIGLLTAIIILFSQFHTFDILQLFADKGLIAQSIIKDGTWIAPLGHLPAAWQYIACGGLFLGVAAKSAQFPLHTWLPDAMEGPTSISALIHAATMVAAGVFLLGRVYPLFNGAELTILAVIGCFTAFMAATIALTQNDLKRILAYSTISQLGFMIMAMGIGAYASSLFHLATHAFFKCLLFLVAGIVIHQMAHIKKDNDLDIDPQNILNMGGLRKKLPLTFIAALIGGLALIGLPLTSGYLSKDGILIQAFEWSDGRSGLYKIIPMLALLTTWLTAFYVARMIVKVFFGELRVQKDQPGIQIHIGDGGWRYKLPLILLAMGCLFPLFSANPLLYERAWLFNGFAPAGGLERENVYHTLIPAGVNILSVLVIYGAYAMYVKRKGNIFPQSGFLYRLSAGEWYFDSIYNSIIVKPILFLSTAAFWIDRTIIDGFINTLADTGIKIAKLCAWIDHHIIDGFLNLLVVIVEAIGNFARRFQGGKVQYYLFSMLVIVLLLFILKTFV